MSKNYRFLLIGYSPGDPWRQIIEEVSTSLGTFQNTGEVDAINLTCQQDYDIIIIDAANVADVSLLISSIKLKKPEAKIIVATASPTWKRAREAYRAGAIDYIRKSFITKEVLAELRAVISKAYPDYSDKSISGIVSGDI